MKINMYTMTKSFLFLVACLFSLQTLTAQTLTITGAGSPPYDVPSQFIRDHLTGPGIEILDVQYTGATGAVGYFTGGTSAIGLNRGLLLTTGRAATAGNSNGAEESGAEFASTDNLISTTDPLLNAVATAPLHDLTRYQITFRASSDSIRFRYVFASEEYPEYACSSFNDVFGFFLQGPGYPVAVNIARVPGTNLPVSINNVHPANGLGCNAKYLQYYNNNNNSNNQPTYDGYLDVFVAEAAVQPCGIYTMTLAIADVSDGAFDSGVFLEAKSFGSSPGVTASFEPVSAVLPENAVANTVSLHFTNLSPSQLPLTVTLGGTAQNGVDYELLDSVATVTTTDTVLYWLVQPLPDTLSELFETVELTVRDTGCLTAIFTLYIADPPTNFQPVDTILLAAAPVVLTAPAPTVLNDQTWTISNDSSFVIAPVSSLLYSSIEVSGSGVPLGQLNDLSLLQSVCVNIQHDFVGDLSLYLIAPDGKFVELSTGNGSSGDNYTSTCFSPAATQPITFGNVQAPASAAPFSGNFQPEGVWDDLLGAPLSGNWKLGVMDKANGFTGQFLNWSMTFSSSKLGNFSYLWSMGDTTKNVAVTTAGLYAVTISNTVGKVKKTFIVLNECSVFTQVATAICPGTSYVFGQEILTEPGVYNDIIPLSSGCDSVVALTLTFLPASTDTLLVVLLPGQSYTYEGQTLTAAGSYSFASTDANGCIYTVLIILSFTTATGEPGTVSTLHFSPNPAVGETLISWDNNQSFQQMRVFDVHGRLVVSQNISPANSVTLSTAGWATGWYSVVLEDGNLQQVRGRLLVKH